MNFEEVEEYIKNIATETEKEAELIGGHIKDFFMHLCADYAMEPKCTCDCSTDVKCSGCVDDTIVPPEPELPLDNPTVSTDPQPVVAETSDAPVINS